MVRAKAKYVFASQKFSVEPREETLVAVSISAALFSSTILTVLLVLSVRLTNKYLARTIVKSIETDKVLRKFLPTRFMSLIDVGPDELGKLQVGRRADMILTVLFADLRGFTAMGESLADPNELFDGLIAYTQVVNPIITAHGGFVDKWMGDGVLCVFHDPEEAVKAALELQVAVKSFNQERDLSQALRRDDEEGRDAPLPGAVARFAPTPDRGKKNSSPRPPFLLSRGGSAQDRGDLSIFRGQAAAHLVPGDNLSVPQQSKLADHHLSAPQQSKLADHHLSAPQQSDPADHLSAPHQSEPSDPSLTLPGTAAVAPSPSAGTSFSLPLSPFPHSSEQYSTVPGSSGPSSERTERANHKKMIFKVGIGIHTGVAVCGLVGDANRVDGTIIGDSVNVAARIEALAGRLGAEIIISDATKARMRPSGSVQMRSLGEMSVAGRSQKVGLWEVYQTNDPVLRRVKERTGAAARAAFAHMERGEYEEASGILRAEVDNFPRVEDPIIVAALKASSNRTSFASK